MDARVSRFAQAPAPRPSVSDPAVFGPRIPVLDVLGGNEAALGAYQPAARTTLTAMARYVAGFLASEHPDLGRSGPVCPFAQPAAAAQLIRLTACESVSETAILAGVAELRGELAELAAWPGRGIGPRHRAIVAVFPHLVEPEGAQIIERIQKRLKPSFVKGRMMIGQFFPSCPEPGLWNPAFRPLQSPVISLAMRNITIYDAPFMLDRDEYVEAFVETFGAAGEAMIAKASRARGRPVGAG
jgi:hypothetical protein